MCPSILESINHDVKNTVFSFIPNTAEVSFYGMVKGVEDYLDEVKAKKIAAFEGKATPEQISRYEAAIGLAVTKMDEEDRRLVWAVAHSAAFRQRGPAWSKIARILSLNDPRIVKRRYKDALVRLYYQL